ncbi:MAG: hypothetical protein WAK96_05395, partial [Desulfobaccales bacterium]
GLAAQGLSLGDGPQQGTGDGQVKAETHCLVFGLRFMVSANISVNIKELGDYADDQFIKGRIAKNYQVWPRNFPRLRPGSKVVSFPLVVFSLSDENRQSF